MRTFTIDKEDLKKMDKIIKTDKAKSTIDSARRNRNTGFKNWVSKVRKKENEEAKRHKRFKAEEK